MKLTTFHNKKLINEKMKLQKVVWKKMISSLNAWTNFRLGKERCRITHMHLNANLKLISGALLSHNLNITTMHFIFMLKILHSSWWLLIRRSNNLLFLWRFSRTISKEVARRIGCQEVYIINDYLILKNTPKTIWWNGATYLFAFHKNG